MASSSYWLYVAGINFSSTLFDTQDLSTIRGSSYGLLAMPQMLSRWMTEQAVEYETIFTGASEGLFRITGGPLADDLVRNVKDWLVMTRDRGAEPFRYLSFGLSVLPYNDEDSFSQAFSILKSQIRLDQLHNATASLTSENGFASDQYCEVDHLRPAVRRENGAKKRLISDSVFNRQEFGKDVKKSFYQRQYEEGRLILQEASTLKQSKEDEKVIQKIAFLEEVIKRETIRLEQTKSAKKAKKIRKKIRGNEEQVVSLRASREMQGQSADDVGAHNGHDSFELPENIRFANSFSDIIVKSPDGVADNLQNKMAVLYMDGNQFTKKMGIVGADTPDVFQKNSRKVKLYQVKLLQRIIEYALKSEGLYYQKGNDKIVRLETLFWGGDEMMLVMPSWAAFDVCRIMFEEMQGWKLINHEGQEDKLTYAAGLVIAHHKTPIIQLKYLAQALADDAKELGKDQDGNRANRNILQYEILESDDIPDAGSLKKYRKRKYSHAFKGKSFADLSFALDGDRMADVRDLIYKFKKNNTVARSRLYNIVNAGLNITGQQQQDNVVTNRYIRKELAHYKKDGLDFWNLLVTSGLGQEKDDGNMQEQEALMALIHMLQLWDYVDALGEREQSETENNHKGGIVNG